LLVFFSKLQTRRNGGATGEIEIQQNKMTKKRLLVKLLMPILISSLPSPFFSLYIKSPSLSLDTQLVRQSPYKMATTTTHKKGGIS
jgi:hypothetical protein